MKVGVKKITKQFTKFFVIGLINTVIDFSILNSLIYVFGLGETNINYLIFKVISFLIACSHSFFWNKNWVFNKKSPQSIKTEISLFYLVASVGLIFNTLISTIIFSISRNYFPEILSANIGALAGLVFVTFWNFIGYKFIVFKK